MRKFSIVLGLIAVSFLAVSCSNFALPERVHVKAEINPNIPLNKASFDLSSQIQKELGNLFTDGTSKVINYVPKSDTSENPQKFLIPFTMMEQSLNFEKYFNEGDLGKDLESINQKFKMENPDKNNTKIAIDMNAAIANILADVTSAPIGPIPVSTGRISIPLTGFSSLSFYSGNLEISFSIPAGQNYTATLQNLTVNGISAAWNSYTLSASSRTVTALFPLDGKTLTNNLTLTYSSPDASYGNTMVVATKISQGAKIQTAKGVSSFTPNNGPISGSDIDLNLSAELVQATIQTGSVTLETDNIKDINLSLTGTKLIQDNNTAANSNYNGVNLQTGLDADLSAGSYTSLSGKLLNPNNVKVAGSYSISVINPNTSEITFNAKGELEILIVFSLDIFSKAYINSKKMIEDFNTGENSKVNSSLGDLSETVKSITYTKAGLKFTFGKVINGLGLTVGSETFWPGESKTKKPIEANTTYENEFTETYNDKKMEVASNTTIKFNLQISSSADDILMLTDVKVGEDVPVLECTPEFVFVWKTAIINPDETVTKGRFPAEGDDGFSLGDNDKLDSILSGLEFKQVDGYLFFTGPESNNKIGLELISYPNSSELKKILYDQTINNGKINIVQTPLEWLEKDEPFTENIDDLIYSTYESDPATRKTIDFTKTFNNMLSGKPLSISYDMQGFTDFEIKNDENMVSVFKAVLVLVVPLELTPADTVNGKTLNVSEYLEGMIDSNLLGSLGSNEGDSANISFNTLTLNVGLTGTPLYGANGKVPNLLIKALTDEKRDPNNPKVVSIPIISSNISIPLAAYLDGVKQTFELKDISLEIPAGGSLKINQGLSLIKFGVNVGVDVTYDL